MFRQECGNLRLPCLVRWHVVETMEGSFRIASLPRWMLPSKPTSNGLPTSDVLPSELLQPLLSGAVPEFLGDWRGRQGTIEVWWKWFPFLPRTDPELWTKAAGGQSSRPFFERTISWNFRQLFFWDNAEFCRLNSRAIFWCSRRLTEILVCSSKGRKLVAIKFADPSTNSSASDVSCVSFESVISKRCPNMMLAITLNTRVLMTPFGSISLPSAVLTVLTSSSTSTWIRVSITPCPNPNSFNMIRHSWCNFLYLAFQACSTIPEEINRPK